MLHFLTSIIKIRYNLSTTHPQISSWVSPFRLKLTPATPASSDNQTHYTMPNPRQRRKVRSGNHSGGKPGTNALRRLHNREKKVADVQGPTVLREGWDKTKTVRQK